MERNRKVVVCFMHSCNTFRNCDMTRDRPGCNAERMSWLIREAIARCRLNLTGDVVFTEAATKWRSKHQIIGLTTV